MHHLTSTPGSLTLIGSGEMTPGMARAHRRVMSQISGEVRPVFLDTPAGFELNFQDISQKAVDYFAEQFSLPLQVASFPKAAGATTHAIETALQLLRQANYIFAGPGSPTYAVRNLRDTPVFETIVAQVRSGAHAVFASAAVVALSRYAIPVYEIYKVGEDPRWTDGLDLLGRFGMDVAFVPHWNNNSGANHDTTRCFIGEPRFAQLQRNLPATTVVLGIDEYTACVMLFEAQRAEVFGAGAVTLVRSDGVQVYQSGESFDLGLLLQGRHGGTQERSGQPDTLSEFRDGLAKDGNPARALGTVQALAETMRHAHGHEAASGMERTIREMLALLAVWLENAPKSDPGGDPAEAIGPYVQVLIDTRQKLRAAKQFGLADQLREAISTAGVVIEDTPEGARWKLSA